jgi:thiamine pyrophosphokinase
MKAVIVASGEPAAGDVTHLTDADLVVAADGGASWLAEVGVRPDLLIGDLDSAASHVVAQLSSEGVTVERHPTDKDSSDAELALDRAVASGAEEVVLVGALGGDRLDHELANLLMLAGARWHPALRDLRIVRGGCVARALHGGEELRLVGQVGDHVSLLAIGGRAEGVRTDGLRYPLAGEPLELGSSRGLSNEVLGVPASVTLEKGTVLVIETAERGGA